MTDSLTRLELTMTDSLTRLELTMTDPPSPDWS